MVIVQSFSLSFAVIVLITDSRCQVDGDLIPLLGLLNRSLIMTDEITLYEGEKDDLQIRMHISSLILSFCFFTVTPHIIAELRSSKPRWLFVPSSSPEVDDTVHRSESSSCLVEEVCVLGAILLFGEGPSGLVDVMHLWDESTDEIYRVSCSTFRFLVLPAPEVDPELAKYVDLCRACMFTTP